MTEPARVTVVGVEVGGCYSPSARRALEQADRVVGWPRHFRELDESLDVDTTRLGSLEECVPSLEPRRAGERVVLLATGDPLFYGIGRHLNERIPSERLRYIPARSSVQLAFAALRVDSTDARVHSLHGRELESLRTPLTQSPPALALFTEPTGNTPRAIYRFLEEIGCDHYRFHLCERVTDASDPPPRITDPSDFPESIDPLNLVVLVRRDDAVPPRFPRPGVPNEVFLPEDGTMVSDASLRMLDLERLEVSGGETVWEVGAATGSISLESARLNPSARYYAVEREDDRFRNLRRNIRRLETFNVIPVHGEASEVLPKWPTPDRVFVGGSGGELKRILTIVDERLETDGIVLANFITLENFEDARRFFHDRSYEVRCSRMTLHETGSIGPYTRWQEGPTLTVLRARCTGE